MISLKDTDGPGTALLETDMTEQHKAAIENYTREAIEVCLKELGLKMPLKILHMDMGGHIVAAEIYEDGEIVPLVDSGRGVSAPLYPVHTLIVDRDGKSALLVLEMEDERMRTLH